MQQRFNDLHFGVMCSSGASHLLHLKQLSNPISVATSSQKQHILKRAGLPISYVFVFLQCFFLSSIQKIELFAKMPLPCTPVRAGSDTDILFVVISPGAIGIQLVIILSESTKQFNPVKYSSHVVLCQNWKEPRIAYACKGFSSLIVLKVQTIFTQQWHIEDASWNMMYPYLFPLVHVKYYDALIISSSAHPTKTPTNFIYF